MVYAPGAADSSDALRSTERRLSSSTLAAHCARSTNYGTSTL